MKEQLLYDRLLALGISGVVGREGTPAVEPLKDGVVSTPQFSGQTSCTVILRLRPIKSKMAQPPGCGPEPSIGWLPINN